MPRVAVNTALLAILCVLAITGTAELFVNGSEVGWFYPLHRGAALALAPLLLWKLPMVVTSLRRRRLAISVWPGLVLMAVVLGLAASGTVWTTGLWRQWDLAGNSALALHLYFLFVIGLPLSLHIWLRRRRPRLRSFLGRRTLLRLVGVGGLAISGVTAFAVAAPWLQRIPAPRRFTGSFVAGDGTGNDFPVTAFLNDDPQPIPMATWSLRVTGRVAHPMTLTYADLLAAVDRTIATVDCTGGWFAEREWAGKRLGQLLESAQPDRGASTIVIRSTTGYFTMLPLIDARATLLATHVGGEPLAHGHGFPLRLVAPSRRGFQWVKWVEQIEVI